LLFDEIEKAHPEIFNTLLQVLDDGRLTDSHGRTVDFRNAIIIMTSNLGSDGVTRESFGFQKKSRAENESAQIRSNVEETLKKAFRPEFINRIDEFVIFDSLDENDIKQIVDKFINEFTNRLTGMNLSIKLSESAKTHLAKIGFDRMYGARPLKRTIQKLIENPLSKEIISVNIEENIEIIVSEINGELRFDYKTLKKLDKKPLKKTRV